MTRTRLGVRSLVVSVVGIAFAFCVGADPRERDTSMKEYVVQLRGRISSEEIARLGGTIKTWLDGSVVVIIPASAFTRLLALPEVANAEAVAPAHVVPGKSPEKGAAMNDALGPEDLVVLSGKASRADFNVPGVIVDEWLGEVVVITASDAGVDALRKMAFVRYVQRVARGGERGQTLQAESAASSPRIHTPKVLTAPTWSSGQYSYDGAGNIKAIGTNSYVYDSASRLVSASESSHTETYAYDGFGNITSITTDAVPHTLSVNATTNRRDDGGFAYDLSGNMRSDTLNSYLYDAFNMMKDRSRGASSHEYYIFDAADERIATIATTGLATEGTWTWTLRDESGKVLREYQTPLGATKALWLGSYVYRDGSLLGADRVAEEGGRRHFHLDHLGTPRLVTGAGGVQLAAHDFYPFGRERTDIHQESLAGMREEPMKFTGHERDFNGGTFSDNTDYLDYMHARYYNPNGGRFLSIDKGSPEPSVPQTWNRYTYALNNPIRFNDPDGRQF